MGLDPPRSGKDNHTWRRSNLTASPSPSASIRAAATPHACRSRLTGRGAAPRRHPNRHRRPKWCASAVAAGRGWRRRSTLPPACPRWDNRRPRPTACPPISARWWTSACANAMPSPRCRASATARRRALAPATASPTASASASAATPPSPTAPPHAAPPRSPSKPAPWQSPPPRPPCPAAALLARRQHQRPPHPAGIHHAQQDYCRP